MNDVGDLVVLGGGAAGLTSALVAAAGGARVVLLEKSSLIGGTAAMSGGAQWIPLNHHMAEVGVTDSRTEALDYLRACEGPDGDEDLLAALVDHGAPMVRHLEDLGVTPPRPWPAVGGTYDYRPWLPGAKHGGRALNHGRFVLAELGEWARVIRVGRPWRVDMLEYYAQQQHLRRPDDAKREGLTAASLGAATTDAAVEVVGEGTALVCELLRACLAHGVVIHLRTRARALVVDAGRVVGVEADCDDAPCHITARFGVLVATGGFGGSDELRRQWLTRPLLATCEIDENEGDGHLMGMAVGAQVANIGDAWWIPFIHKGVEGGVVNAAGSREDRILPHTVIVNQAGRRFINEATNYYDFAEGFGLASEASSPNVPAWLLFDRQGVERYAMLAFKVPPGQPPDWLTVAESIPDLATKLGIDSGALVGTIDRFNRFATDGVDLDFHRGDNAWDLAWGDPDQRPNPCLGTLAKPPYYAVQVVPGALATKGGLRVNARGEVLGAAPPHDPIAGLYAAGNCSSAGPARSYPGPGATIGAAMTFGYLVGREAARWARD